MHLLFASDSFKGSLTSARIGQLLTQAAGQIFPQAKTTALQVADGGEGTMETVVEALGGSWTTCRVTGPLGRPVQARYGVLPGGKAIIEMAEASGLTLIPPDQRNAAQTTSRGTGMLIRHALDAGLREITLAIGGSGTNDGGMGAMAALGVRFLDGSGRELSGCGAQLGAVERIELDGLHPGVSQARFTVMCDVTNPLLGQTGATYTYGRQKGADDSMLDALEQGMTHYAARVAQALGRDRSQDQGAGAAGGLGFALLAFLDAQAVPGIEAVLDLLEFDRRLEGVDLVITGEGRMDWQSSFGKVPAGVGRRCRRAGVPAVAIVGGLLAGYEAIYDCGVESVVTTINGAMSLEEAIDRREELYLDAACRLLRMIRCGMEMGNRPGAGNPSDGSLPFATRAPAWYTGTI